jgi:hypothetical protein
MDTKWEQKWFSDFYNYTGDNGPKTNNNEYYISPFAKWTENDEWHYKNDKGYKKAKSGKYIINTASAKSWRTLTTIDLPKLLNITDNNSFVMVQWIQGKKVTDSVNIANYNSDISQYDKVSNSTKFTDWVVNNYNQHQE